MARASQTHPCPPTDHAPERCPLCGGPNDCRLCTSDAYKGACWCESVTMPDELLVRVPPEARNLACICRVCVSAFDREQSGVEHGSRRREEADSANDTNRSIPPPQVSGYEGMGQQTSTQATPVVPGDFYFGADGLMVFTVAYHLRRGYCCGNDCRHCPYQPEHA